MILRAHRTVAFVLIAFVALHLGVHLTALAGPDLHLATLPIVRPIYRNDFAEPLLIALFAAQISLGLTLAWRRRSARIERGWGTLQLASGLYIAFFILLHSTAALFARYANHLDTNFWWPASTLAHPTLRYYFYPYYFLGIASLFFHLASALHFRGANRGTVRKLVLAGPVIAILIVAAFGGLFRSFAIPEKYMAALNQTMNVNIEGESE